MNERWTRTKLRGIELAFEVGDALRLEVVAAVGVDRDVVRLRFDDLDPFDRDHVHLFAVADQDAFEPVGRMRDQLVERRLRLAQAGAGAREAVVEARFRERLEQVVDRMQVERLLRVLVVGRREDDAIAPAGELEHLEAGQLGHVDVEEDEVGRQLADRLRGVEAVLRLAGNGDVGMVGEVLAHQEAGEFLVVGDEGAQRGHAADSRPGATMRLLMRQSPVRAAT